MLPPLLSERRTAQPWRLGHQRYAELFNMSVQLLPNGHFDNVTIAGVASRRCKYVRVRRFMRGKLASQVVHAIVEHIREQRLPAGHHLGAQQLADMLRVSRAPVSAALKGLGEVGIVYSEPNRGYFVAKPIGHLPSPTPAPPVDGEKERLYFQIAEDRL